MELAQHVLAHVDPIISCEHPPQNLEKTGIQSKSGSYGGSRIWRLLHRTPTRKNNTTRTAVVQAYACCPPEHSQRTVSFIATVGVRQSSIEMKDKDRDVLRRTILELVKKGHVHYTDIEKKACATCLSFATSNTVRRQLYHYLLPNDYIERISRGLYKLTQKGEKLLEILT